MPIALQLSTDLAKRLHIPNQKCSWFGLGTQIGSRRFDRENFVSLFVPVIENLFENLFKTFAERLSSLVFHQSRDLFLTLAGIFSSVQFAVGSTTNDFYVSAAKRLSQQQGVYHGLNG